MILQVAMRILVDVRIVEIDLIVLDSRKRVANLAFAGTQRFHFRAVQHDAGLERLDNVIIASRFGMVRISAMSELRTPDAEPE